MVPVLIPAAGQSARMRGRDKLAEIVAGVPLLRLQAMRAASIGPVFVTLPSLDHARVDLLAGLDVTLIPVPNAAQGLAQSLVTGVVALPDCAAFMIVLPDLIALESNDLAAIVQANIENPTALVWRGATQVGKPGHPILCDASLRPEFTHLQGDTGGAPVLKKYQEETHLVSLPGDRALRDLDTPEEWAKWRTETGDLG